MLNPTEKELRKARDIIDRWLWHYDSWHGDAALNAATDKMAQLCEDKSMRVNQAWGLIKSELG